MKGTYIRLNEEVNFLRRSRAKEILKIEALRWRLLEHIKNIVFPAYQRAFAAIKRLRGAYYVCEEGVRVYKFTKSHFGDSISWDWLKEVDGHPLIQLAQIGREMDYQPHHPKVKAGAAFVRAENWHIAYRKRVSKVEETLEWALRERTLLPRSWKMGGSIIFEMNGRHYQFEPQIQKNSRCYWPDPSIPIVQVT